MDDRPANLLALEAVLGDLGTNLIRAGSGDEALQRVQETDFAAVLLDVQMARLSGLEVAKLVRARSRRTPIIFLTSDHGADLPVEEAYALGAVDFLARPLVPAVLRARVAVFIDLFRWAREARTAELARADAAAREQDQLWRTTLASIGDAVIATDPEGQVTFLNPVAEALTGWASADAHGQPLTEVFRIVNETTRVPVDNPALRALKTGTIVGLANHTILIARDGTERPIDDSAAPIRGANGSLRGAVLVFRDITERKRAEVALARLAAIVESSADAIVGKTLGGVIEFWNAGAERLFGYTAAEAVGRHIALIVPPERAEEDRRILERIRRGERIEHFVTARQTKGGSRVDISLTVSPIRDAEGHIIGASKVARDVSERKRAEEQVRRATAEAEDAQRTLQALMAHVPEGIVLTGGPPDFRLKQVSRYGIELTGHGVPGTDLVGMPTGQHQEVWGLRRPDGTPLPAEEASLFRASRLGEEVSNQEVLLRRPDGRDVPLLVSAAPIRDREGRVVGAINCWRDVGDLKRSERALAEARRRSETALQTGEVGTYYWDVRADRVTGDRNFVAIFGVLADDRSSAPIGDFITAIHPEDRDRVGTAIRRTLETDAPFRNEYRVVKAAGVRWLLAHGVVERDAGGPVGWAGVVVDITDRKAAEQRLAESEEQFRSLFESMDEGYCVVEPVLDGTGRAVDYRYLLVNPALEAHTGLTNVVGRTAREVMPAHESHWIEAYARVAATGEPVRRTDYVADLGRWFDVSAFRLGAPARGHVGVLFTDVTARKQAENAVLASEHQLAEVFRHAPAFMGVLRGAGHVFERANDRYIELVGGRELVGRAVKDALPEVVDQGYIDLLDRVYRTGEPHIGSDARVTLARAGRPPEERFLDFVYQPLRDAGGNVSGIIVQGIDQTDRKRAEALLREQEQRMQLLLGSAADYAVVITDPAGRVLDWLGGAAAITGFTAEDVVGRPAEVIFTPEDRAAGVPAREMGAAARDGRAEDKRWHLKKDGGQFFADGVMVPLRGAGGVLHGFGKVFRDATARKRAEDAVRFLADASASLAELVDYESTLGRIANMAVGGFADWCVVDVLDADGARRRLAVTTAEPDELTEARGSDALFRPEDGAAGIVPHVLRTGEPEVVFDLSGVDAATAPQGPERVRQLLALGVRSYLCTPLLSRGRVIGGMTFLSSSHRRRFGPDELHVAQNLAERVTTAIENAQLYHTLQEQDRRKDEFLATLAHELRNPLAPVRNGVEILRAAVPPEPRLERTLGMMDRQLGQMVHLIDDLMDVSRVSSGKVVLRKERVALRSVVDAAVETTRPVVEASGHELALRLPPEPVTINADRTRLVQVLANLLNNAAKYTPQGGRIVLSAARTGADAVVRVTDTGVGIPADMLPKVFDMFTQVGTSLERSQGGLGIGLTLVKRLVEMHGGTVAAESPGLGKGSTFTVRLPLVEDRPPAADARSDAAQEPAANTFGVLVVDDNRDAAESMALLLEIRGHEVRTAHDGPAALRELATFRPKLVLLDLGLPGMSGYEVARRVRESAEVRDVTLVALTGWGQEEDRRRTREAGFDHHLVKPADPAALERILNGVQARG